MVKARVLGPQCEHAVELAEMLRPSCFAAISTSASSTACAR